MPLLVAGLLPHSPLLIPEIGRANRDFLGKSLEAYNFLGKKLKNEKIETLIIISPHASLSEEKFCLNVAPEMSIDLKDFGFIPERNKINGDSILADKLTAVLKSEFELDLTSEKTLDYGSAIPAYLLEKLASKIKLVVLAPAENLSAEEHFRFGEIIGESLKNNPKKTAIIVSGDLSHSLKKKSPGGYSPKAAKFDNKLIENLSDNKNGLEKVLKTDLKIAKEVGECALRPIFIILGVLKNHNFTTEVLGYDTEFGVGYLSLDFNLKSEEEEK